MKLTFWRDQRTALKADSFYFMFMLMPRLRSIVEVLTFSS